METFIKVTKKDQYGDTLLEFIEEPYANNLSMAIEEELLSDLIEGQTLVLTVVDFTRDEVERFNEDNGYA